MNTQTEDALEILRQTFVWDKERREYAKRAPEAMRRLAKACYGHDNSQALTIVAALASIYDGASAPGVRLDDIRSLDWPIAKDLVDVMLGVGVGGVRDSDIREALRAIGGQAAVDWFHRQVNQE